MSSAVPAGWAADRFDRFITLQRGHDLPLQDRLDGEIPIYGSNGIVGFHDETITDETGVITGRSGSIGHVYFVKGKYWALNTTLYVNNFHANSREFVAYFMVHFGLERFSTGTGVPTLNRNDVHLQNVVFPPLPEQKKIASILTSVDEVIENTQKQIDKLQDLKKATMNELLTKGIGHTEFKDTELGRIPKSWDVRTLNECCEILDSQRIPLNAEERAKRKGDYPYYGANGVQGYIDDYIFDGDAILLAEDGGNFDQYAERPIAQWVTGRFWVNNHAHILRAKSGLTDKWVYYSTVHKNILKYINGGTRAKLNQSDLKEIAILISPLPEQKKIASILTSMDITIGEKQRKLSQTQSLKKSLMQDLLTGKVRVAVN